MPLRVVTAAAIFDGHDVAIGIFRRILQSQGCEVIHLGHDRGADEVARAAIQEDAHAIAITSYQGGAVEMFTHTKEILDESGFDHVFLFGGGGGTILPHEIEHLVESGIARIYSPDDGRELGLVGMVQDASVDEGCCHERRKQHLWSCCRSVWQRPWIYRRRCPRFLLPCCWKPARNLSSAPCNPVAFR